jgi:hypothetical protein
MRYIIILTVLLASCNPCKQIGRNPDKYNCFPSDTIIKEREVIKHIKEYVTNDSIVRDTVPCDPITNTYYKTKTVYQTKTIHETDTIKITEKETRLNPVNKELEQRVTKLEEKKKSQRKWITRLIGLSLLLACTILLLIKFK